MAAILESVRSAVCDEMRVVAATQPPRASGEGTPVSTASPMASLTGTGKPERVFNIASYATRVVRESPILITVGRMAYHDYRTRQDHLAPSCWIRPGWSCPALPASADVAAVSRDSTARSGPGAAAGSDKAGT